MRTVLFAAAMTLAALSGCSKSEKTETSASPDLVEENLPTISIDEVDRGLAAKTLTAVDCNSDKTRKKHGVLPGAILIVDEEMFGASELPADKATKLVFYCSGPG